MHLRSVPNNRLPCDCVKREVSNCWRIMRVYKKVNETVQNKKFTSLVKVII